MVGKLGSCEIAKARALNIEEGERWYKKTSIREIVFGFNDGSTSTYFSIISKLALGE